MYFVNVYFNGELQKQVSLDKALTTIGRDDRNDICIENPGVSANHARIVREGNTFFIEDAGSTNGTSVNGEMVGRKELQYGDKIGVLKHTLRFTPLALDADGNDVAVNKDSAAVDTAGTTDMDVSQLQELLKQQASVQRGHLLISSPDGKQRKRPLDRQTFSIGKCQFSDLVIKGWFVPKNIANIDRKGDGYYLIPLKRARVELNGSRVRGKTRLRDKDMLVFRRNEIRFVLEQPQP